MEPMSPLYLVLALLIFAPGQSRSAGYDPARDPIRDLEATVKQAQQDNKRIVVVLGGEWCAWCHVLENYLRDNADVRSAWSSAFITLKVNFSRENENRAFLKQFPDAPAFPHFFVLEKDGKLLHSQSSLELEDGTTYSKDRMMRFIGKWRTK